MITWAERIKLRMKELGLTQEELAQKVGITRGAITHYLSGRRVPPLKQFQKLAHALKTNPAWLQFGAITDKDKKSNNTQTCDEPDSQINYFQIPILTWEQLAKQPDANKINKKVIGEWVQHTYTELSKLFALRVKGDSMVSTTGHKSFNDGDIIIVDPNLNPKTGDYIVAVMPNKKEATFKQLVVDGGTSYLKPLNTQYPIIELISKYICSGVVIRSISEFK